MKNWDVRFFDVIAPVYNVLRYTWGSPKKSAQRIEILVKISTTDVLLDLGGATGIVGKYFVNKVKKVIVIDPSSSLNKAERQGMETRVGYAEKIPLHDASVDIIIIVDAFHHFADQTKALQECYRILKLGGKIVIEEFNQDTFLGRMMARYEHLLQFKSKFFKPTDSQCLATSIGLKAELFDTKSFRYYAVLAKC